MLYDLILQGGTVVNQNGVNYVDIAVKDGKIVNIGTFNDDQAKNTISCQGLHILPGVIDSQVHFREPGNEHKEDLETGSLAAVMGGVTAVFEMPNTNPSTTSVTALQDKIKRATSRMHCDFAFYVGAATNNIDQLASLEKLPGCCGVKVFMGSSTGSLLVADDYNISLLLNNISRRAAFHAEDEGRLNNRKCFIIPAEPSSHAEWRDVDTALNATKRVLNIAKEAGKRVHILHVTTAQEMELLANYRDIATVEVTPQHLTLYAPDVYNKIGTYAQMNPPIRGKEHQDALWKAINSGLVDVIGSDHAPHTIEEKQKQYPESPSGMPGVQTLVPIMLDHVNKGHLSLERFVDLTSHGPARIFALANKGRIARGYDADFTIVDLNKSVTICNNNVSSKCGWSQFDGYNVIGWPIGTIIRGNTVMWEGKLVTPSEGRPLSFVDNLWKN